MSSIDFIKTCSVVDSFRVNQVAGMFDLDTKKKSSVHIKGDIPDDDDWQIGAIVGPSGSGKTLIARERFGDKLFESGDWIRDAAVIDGFGEHETKKITHLLTAVGFSSPPAWIKPYNVLSNGEQFRCQIAKSFLNSDGLVAFDEFTSVVDRNVAKVCSAAIAKSIRNNLIDTKFVAVTCHYDILDWLEVDWYLDMLTGKLERRRLRRPGINIEVFRCKSSLWKTFKKHHYLNSNMGAATHCYCCTVDGKLAGFASIGPFFGRASRKIKRFNRLVILPDYQGIGVGSHLFDIAAGLVKEETKYAVRATMSHPGLIRHVSRSKNWLINDVEKLGKRPSKKMKKRGMKTSAGRAIISAEYIGHKNKENEND